MLSGSNGVLRTTEPAIVTVAAWMPAIFVSIPHANVIWAVAGLVIFGGYTILDFNRLRRTGADSAVPIAASIFLDVVNVFLFFLELFGGRD